MSRNLRGSGALSCNFMVGVFLGVRFGGWGCAMMRIALWWLSVVRFGGWGCAMVRIALWWLSVVRFAGWGSAFLQFS